MHWLGPLKPIEGLAVRIVSPIQSRVYALGVSINNLYLTVSGKNQPLQVNQELQTQIQTLAVANAELQTRLEEVEALIIQQDFLKQEKLPSVTARVIGRSVGPDVQGIILNKGSADGVAVDMPLITDAGILVGKIYKVTSRSSEAILINDSLSRISAIIQNTTRTQGIVIGEHGLSLNMELVPQNDTVSINNLVVTAGVEPRIPRGLVIGQVSRVSTEPNSLFQTVRVRPLLKVDSLVIVSILISNHHD